VTRRHGKPVRRRDRRTASQAIRPTPIRRPDRSESITERLDAVYAEDESASALDGAIERLQFLSLPPEEKR